jgi:hypothetical protein
MKFLVLSSILVAFDVNASILRPQAGTTAGLNSEKGRVTVGNGNDGT